MKIFVQDALPHQPKGKGRKPIKFEPQVRREVAGKINGMLQRGYLELGQVKSQLHYFAVPKGDEDIRVVYDGTLSGLNSALWAPNFYLPTARTASELLSFDTWMADVDFGEFFHNFHMDARIKKFAGVDIAPLHPFVRRNEKPLVLEKGQELRWGRLFMGMKPSPYNSVRHYYWGEEFARGNPRNLTNPFGYDQILLNLPSMESYDPTKPKLMKWNSALNAMAGDVVTFVDDVRMTGSSKENCHEVHHRFASRMQYLGLQDAPRKFRPPSQVGAGAWTGTIFCVGKDTISKTVSAEKWGKGRAMIEDLSAQLANENGVRPQLDRKLLERQTGFLNHLAMTFEDLSPFLKGFYLTLNSWRDKRDDQDWKMTDKAWVQMLIAKLENQDISEREFDVALEREDASAPKAVTASLRLADDVKALSSMFGGKDPPVVRLRSKSIVTVVCGFGDASGTGLGATFTCGSGLSFRVGVWGAADREESSNWKEFTNVVESLEEEAAMGNLSDSEVFMFTDNSTVEACAVKGSSTSPKLLDLIIRLRSLSTSFGFKLHIFHVSGTRMIAQGTDGVSRGFLGGGIMSGEAMTSFIPIHLSALQRSPSLIEWIRSWSCKDAISLSEMDWFDIGHDIDGWEMGLDGFERPVINQGRTYVWSPPPYVADMALSEMRKARIKRQQSTHIVVCPRLCSSLWARHLYKAADIVFEIPAGRSFWGSDLHEPLLIGILFPFLSVKPWQLRSTPKMFSVARKVRGLCQDDEVDLRNLLRKFWDQCHRLRSMQQGMVRKLLYFCE